jgi:pimeloyl-[acyl-carrier protein] methyl ester esterase
MRKAVSSPHIHHFNFGTGQMTHLELNRRQTILVGAAALFLHPQRAFAAEPILREFTAVEAFGDGPDVVFMPGWGSSREVWRPIAEKIASTRRVHLIQVRGFAGLSPPSSQTVIWDSIVKDIAGYVATLKAPVFIGHSMGGATGLRLAAEHPGTIGKLLIVDSLPFYMSLFNPAATAQDATAFAGRMSDGLLSADAAQFQAMQVQSAAILSKSAAARQRIAAWSVASDRKTLASTIHALISTDLRPSLPRIETPATIAFAWDAAMGRPVDVHDAFWRAQYAGLKNAAFVRVDNSFHFIMDDQPERFEAVVRNALS